MYKNSSKAQNDKERPKENKPTHIPDQVEMVILKIKPNDWLKLKNCYKTKQKKSPWIGTHSPGQAEQLKEVSKLC